MRYFFYFVLLYISLPLNRYIDIVTMLVFLIAIKEDYYYTIVFAFFSGMILDLYYPSSLGVNMIMYLVLVQLLLHVKKYLAQNVLITVLLFVVFYLTKVIISYVLVSMPISVLPIFATIILFIPILTSLNRLFYGAWLKI
jgi:rod shape-determining protein MreD